MDIGISARQTLAAGALAITAVALTGCNKARSPAPAVPTAAETPAAMATPAAPAAPSASPTSSYVLADPRFDPLPDARALYGRLGGATYEIEVPNAWNGDLVLYAHGFTGTDPVLFIQTPPIRAYLIAHGFAWAASSFSASGYAPDVGLADTLALRDYFTASVAAPARTYVYGTSMGGHIVVSAMEQHPELFAGGFSECGVVGGVAEIDYLDSWVALAAYLTGVRLLPITSDATFAAQVRQQVLPALGSAASPSLTGQQFEDIVANLTGGPRPWRHQGFLDRRSGNFDLAAMEDPKHPSLAFLAGTNAGVRYHVDAGLGIDDETLNAQVPRLPPDPQVRDAATHPDFAPRTGHLQAPLLTIHTTGDHFVPISQEVDYRRLVDDAGAGDLLVQRAIRRPDHCQFSETEREQGFSDLVNWVENGVRPDGEDFSSGDLSDAGRRFTTPLLPGDPGDE